MVDCDTFIPALWNLLVMSVDFSFGVWGGSLQLSQYFSQLLLFFLANLFNVWLLVHQWILPIPNASTMALIKFPYFLSFQMACFSAINISLVMLANPF